MHKNASPFIFERAKNLRERETKSEKHLWEYLKKKKLEGFKFRRQHPISKYILDFYCHEKKLVIELDGSYHETKEQQLKDIKRTKALKEMGLKVIRFKNKEVLENTEFVLWEIRNKLLEDF